MTFGDNQQSYKKTREVIDEEYFGIKPKRPKKLSLADRMKEAVFKKVEKDLGQIMNEKVLSYNQANYGENDGTGASQDKNFNIQNDYTQHLLKSRVDPFFQQRYENFLVK